MPHDWGRVGDYGASFDDHQQVVIDCPSCGGDGEIDVYYAREHSQPNEEPSWKAVKCDAHCDGGKLTVYVRKGVDGRWEVYGLPPELYGGTAASPIEAAHTVGRW